MHFVLSSAFKHRSVVISTDPVMCINIMRLTYQRIPFSLVYIELCSVRECTTPTPSSRCVQHYRVCGCLYVYVVGGIRCAFGENENFKLVFPQELLCCCCCCHCCASLSPQIFPFQLFFSSSFFRHLPALSFPFISI